MTMEQTRERVIFVFPRERRAEVEETLGIPKDGRQNYQASELMRKERGRVLFVFPRERMAEVAEFLRLPPPFRNHYTTKELQK